jgi:energy-converting hydrogenase Eha subunit F
MFGRVANTLDRNVIIFLSVTAAILLLAGLCLAVTASPAKAQAPPRPVPAKAAQANTTAAIRFIRT